MRKRMTITGDEAVYDGLVRVSGRRTSSRFRNNLARPLVPRVTHESLAGAYKAMAADAGREREALEWSNALIGDVSVDMLAVEKALKIQLGLRL